MKSALLKFLIFFSANLLFLSCSSSDAEDEQLKEEGLQGWYADLSNVKRNDHWYDFLLFINGDRSSFFLNDGKYETHYDNNWSKIYDGHDFSIETKLQAIHIVNDNTLVLYNCELYKSGSLHDDSPFSYEQYKSLGRFAYYDPNPQNYTYFIINNKLWVSNGDIYTISGKSLIKDGSSKQMTKYNPSSETISPIAADNGYSRMKDLVQITYSVDDYYYTFHIHSTIIDILLHLKTPIMYGLEYGTGYYNRKKWYNNYSYNAFFQSYNGMLDYSLGVQAMGNGYDEVYISLAEKKKREPLTEAEQVLYDELRVIGDNFNARIYLEVGETKIYLDEI